MSAYVRMLPSGSSLDLASKCAASAALPSFGKAFEAGEEGTDLHEFAQALAEGGDPDLAHSLPPSIRERGESLLNALPLEILFKLTSEVAVSWDVALRKATHHGNHIGREYPKNPTAFNGAMDWGGVVDGVVRVVELKTGRIAPPPAKRNKQLALAALALAHIHRVDSAVVTLIHSPPDARPTVDVHEYNAFDLSVRLPQEFAELAQRIEWARKSVSLKKPPRVNIGEHCRWCPSFEACPATVARLVQKREQIEAEASETVRRMNDVEILEMRDHVAFNLALWHRVKGTLETIALQRAAQGAPVMTPDGKKWCKSSVPVQQIDAMTAFDVLEKAGADREALGALVKTTTTKTALTDVVRVLKEEGKFETIKDGVAQTLEAVRAAGGITVTTRETWGEWDT